jgi:hypothetical protein
MGKRKAREKPQRIGSKEKRPENEASDDQEGGNSQPTFFE